MATLPCALVAMALGHASMVNPPPRNAVDRDLAPVWATLLRLQPDRLASVAKMLSCTTTTAQQLERSWGWGWLGGAWYECGSRWLAQTAAVTFLALKRSYWVPR
jgi:hypothetical protein